MLEVTLPSHGRSPRSIALRELCGHDEMAVANATVGVAGKLLKRLLVDAPGSAYRSDGWEQLSVSDRDVAVAQLQAHYFGPQIESRALCQHCCGMFEFGFSLPDLVASVLKRADEERRELGIAPSAAEGCFERGELRFRVPTLSDEQALLGLAPEAHGAELRRRCLALNGASADLSPTSDVAEEELQRSVDVVSPLISAPLELCCALCGVVQDVEFDVVAFFLLSLLRERPLLIREIHAVATAYRWHCSDILALPRSQRRAHVELIESERMATLEVAV